MIDCRKELNEIDSSRRVIIKEINDIKKRKEEYEKCSNILLNQNKINEWKFKDKSKIQYNPYVDTYYYNDLHTHEYIYYKDIDIENGLIDIKSGKITVEFNAIATLNITLHILGYKDGEKIFTEVIECNQIKTFTLEKGIKLKLYIRVKGNGLFKIKLVNINNDNLWISNNIEEEFNKVNGFYKWVRKNKSLIKYNSYDDTYFYSDYNNHEYIYYKDINLSEDALVKVDKGVCTVNFSADANLDLQLHILGYENKEKVFHKIMKPQSKIVFTVEDNVKLRVCVRVKGVGFFKINNILINNISLWNNSKEAVSIANYSKNNTVVNYKYDNKKSIYYSIDDSIILSKLEGKQYQYLKLREDFIETNEDKYFDVNIDFKSGEDIQGTLVAVINKNDSSKEVIEILNNNTNIIKVSKDTIKIEYFIKIQGSGYVSFPILLVNEIEYSPINKIDIDVNTKNWFNNYKKQIKLSNEDGLKGEVNIEPGVNRYISYLETNNGYNSIPENVIFKVDDNNIYTIKCSINSDETLQVYPMLIFYDETKKLQVIQISKNKSESIKPPMGAKYIRIALRISGYGSFVLNKIFIEEYETLKCAKAMEWSDVSELNLFNISKKKDIKEIKIAIIMDEFTTACYEDECTLIKVTPENWKAELIEERPDMLFVESAWRGNGGKWFKKVGDYGEENNKELKELIQWCKLNNIPTVFWNKEDPVHFNRFVNTAKDFDVIFTTDENSVINYVNETGNTNVYSLPFAAQPKKHNPIRIVDERINKACFAGSYYKLHEERRIDMEMILDEVREYGLDIYDRNYDAVMKGLMPNHTFPKRFKDNIKGSLKYYEIDKAYKGYKLMVNLNTVKYSPTMFSRRVFEGLACGTPVISSYSQGMERMFKDIVYIAKEKGDLKDVIPKLLNDSVYYNKLAMTGMREVFEKHTYEERIYYILDKLNIPFKKRDKRITLLAIAKSEKEFKNIVTIYNKQSYKNKELIILIDKFEGYLDLFKKYNNNGIYTYILSYMHNYSNIKELITSDYVGFIDTKNYYGENYIRDLMMCTKYTEAEIIGKGCYYEFNNNDIVIKNKNNDFKYVTEMESTACICKTDLFMLDGFIDIIKNYKNINFKSYLNKGYRIYSADYFNYISNYDEKSNKHIIDKIKSEIEF